MDGLMEGYIVHVHVHRTCTCTMYMDGLIDGWMNEYTCRYTV